MKPTLQPEFRQVRNHLPVVGGRSVSSFPAVMPWVNDAKESIVSMSRRLTTLILKKSAKGGFKNGAN
jgi:hypothetical protein